MSRLYPPIATYHQEMLDVAPNQQLYLELAGNPSGFPVLVLHGGPGAGLSADYRRIFDPTRYHIIGFDQRGCGRSTPYAQIADNSTEQMLADITHIRQHLKIDKWMLYGGSWGATLALLAAINQPQTVTAIVLRGVYLAREQDRDWFLHPQGGAAQIFPEHYANFHAQVSHASSAQEVAAAYSTLLHAKDDLARLSAVRAWCLWEEWISRLHHPEQEPNPCYDLHKAKTLAQLECHYLNHNCFIEENYILDNIDKIQHIPGSIIHGRYDMVCKIQSAYELTQAWSNSQLMIVPDAGHSASEPGIADAICQATDAVANFFEEEKS